QRLHSRYIYDLGEHWMKFTGLPFVFAAWIANKELPEDFVSVFNEANSIGLQHLDQVIQENPFTAFDLRKYYTECISYDLNEEKRKGLDLFLEKLKMQQVFS
ncbi:MAG TPA: MqnA/MqnD/SBP family protein, partial [Flavisolibacter sp.]|nr:MqnA/MqnD/SBP family protein [Flavisolibacter sp.]